jgi:glycosyltransferase involved in cell wall biosynthesis
MRIGINALFLQKPATGSGQHLFHLLEGLDAYDKENAYVLLSPRFRRAYAVTWPHLSDRFQNVQVMSALAQLGENVEKTWWEQVGLLQAGRAENVDLLHCPYFAAPLVTPFPIVVTIHDVIPLILKEYAWRKLTRLYNLLVSTASKRAQAIIAVSQCSKRDIERTLHIPSDRIHVIGNAVDESFRPITDAWQLQAVRDRYNIGERYVLYFGGFDLRKNVRGIIRAYAQLPAELRAQQQLVVAGRLHLLGHPLYPDPRPLVRELGLDGQVVFTGQIREQDKAPLYSGATAFVFPSLYEGFGMPVLEAMACGTPVLTSETSALPEVVGDAGVLVDPASESAISAALGRLLEDEKLRAELGQRALDRARFFTWRQVAEQTVEVYRKVGAA